MKNITKNKAWNIVEDYNCDKLLYLLIDRPTKITRENDFIWKNHRKQLHSKYDFPAVVWNDGVCTWRKNNKTHRENNKPAFIYTNGNRQYWLNNKFIK